MKIKHPKIIGALSILAFALGGGIAYETNKHRNSSSETKLHSTQPDTVKDKEQEEKVTTSEKNSSSTSSSTNSNSNEYSNFEASDKNWIYGTPPELNGITYFTFNDMGETIGSIEFTDSTIIEYAGHSHTLLKGENVKYKSLGNGQYLFEYDEILNGQVTHKMSELITNGDTWQYNHSTFYKDNHTWFVLTQPEWAKESDIEEAKKQNSNNEINNSNPQIEDTSSGN